jgi:CBS domain containing-hemolysin-like protein
MSILISFAIIGILILLNGMFVAAEFAIIGVRPTRIEQLADEGNATARRLRDVMANPAKVDRYIASAQLGITLASLGLGMYGEPAIAHLLEPALHDWFGLEGEIVHTISFLVGLGLITYLHVVIGEMVPKSIALQNAEGAVLTLATPMILMQTIFAIPITLLNKLGVLFLKLVGVQPPDKGSRLHTPDELELIISESVVGGLVDGEHRIFTNIFDFAELRVNQIMTPRPKIEAIPADITEEDLRETMFSSPHTRLPVYEGDLDHIIGVLHVKDFIQCQLQKQPYDLRSMIHQVPIVPEGMRADRLLETLKQKHVHLSIVMDEYGGTAGIVTLEDLIEEVVGEVQDEFDVDEQAPITVVEPGHIIAQGSVRLDEIEEYVDLGEFDYDVESIGGLVLTQVNLPPRRGDEVEFNQVKVRVEEVNGLAIERVSIHYTPVDGNPSDQNGTH